MPHWDESGNEEWVCQVGAHICAGTSTWFDGIGNVCDKCKPVVVEFSVKLDENEPITMWAASIAALTNRLRKKANRVRVWVTHSDLQLIDTKFGDTYNLVK